MSQSTRKILFELRGIPKFTEALPLAMQHVVAMIIGCITPAIVISVVANVSPEDTMLLIQASLVTAAIATFIQLYPVAGRVGAGIPVVMGVSFAYVPVLIAIGGSMGLPAILGAQIVGGFAAIIVGIFIRRLRPLFPPLVSGTVVFTIGLSLYPVAIRYMAGGAGMPGFGSALNWGVALFTLAAVSFFSFFTKGFTKLASVLLGMAAGYILAASLGMVSFERIIESQWFQLPQVNHFKIEFHVTAVVSMVIMYIVNSIQAIGDISATTAGAMDREPSDDELAGGIMGNGLSSMLSAFIGGLPTATFSQNVGIVTITKVINKFVIALAAAIILLAGLIPKFAALLTTIPLAVLGGATLTVFAAITMTGMKLLLSAKLTPRNSAVVGISVALGVGISQVANALGGPGMPSWAQEIFGSSSVIISTLAAVALNVIMPRDKKEL
ncbi:uracil-xanthine permease family protein [Cloacibacillus evryensis]|uniref:uracil-xanthine permease family protein n=1 Tax=Cloacibacillus evryensis TaxID=508460 RepID=UPI002109F369|nr:nucleobase:cation symporter-2 family protein [Cloacibacillus evryensis]MCQ4764911.1 purine permease [Cloacibacillus evryensis]